MERVCLVVVGDGWVYVEDIVVVVGIVVIRAALDADCN